MNIVEHFERRKQWCEEELRLAETTPSFRLFRRTHGGGEIDLTEKRKEDLRDARDAYQRAIDLLLEEQADGTRAEGRPRRTKRMPGCTRGCDPRAHSR
jgi:hypothetical protein